MSLISLTDPSHHVMNLALQPLSPRHAFQEEWDDSFLKGDCRYQDPRFASTRFGNASDKQVIRMRICKVDALSTLASRTVISSGLWMFLDPCPLSDPRFALTKFWNVSDKHVIRMRICEVWCSTYLRLGISHSRLNCLGDIFRSMPLI